MALKCKNIKTTFARSMTARLLVSTCVFVFSSFREKEVVLIIALSPAD